MADRTSPVTRVDFAALPTKDLDAATEFYGEVLGLPRSSVYRRDPEQPAAGAEFETGNLTLSVIVTEMMGLAYSPNKTPIALNVDDVEATRSDLESRGISFMGETLDTGVCHMAFFEDPDGNALMLHHRYAPKAAQPQA
jgi:predicted enzyme related to lactoylglutathione lyase